jgi:hypothetical protein
VQSLAPFEKSPVAAQELFDVGARHLHTSIVSRAQRENRAPSPPSPPQRARTRK